MSPIAVPLPLLTLPFLAGLAGLLAFADASLPASRRYARGASLAITLLVALLTLLTGFGGPAYLAGGLLRAALAILLAQLIAAPLLDRARLMGLLGGSVLACFALLSLLVDQLPLLLPIIPRSGWVLAALLAASLCGLAGGSLIPAHPARTMRHGSLRQPAFSNARDFGLLLFAVSIALFAWGDNEGPLSLAFCISALTAALYPLIVKPGAYRLHRAAEGVLAGTIIVLMAQGSELQGVAYGIIAAVLVERGELIAASMGMDDAPRLTGAVLLPAIAGLLLPTVNDLPMLATLLRWLGGALLTAGIACLVWPVAMATVGLAAATRHVREGLDFNF